MRQQIRSGASAAPDSEADAAARIAGAALAILAGERGGSLRRVINATGVIVHTNLGRAPLAQAAVARAAEVASGYSNLEYDIDGGERGHRHVHAEARLRALTGAESALVVNNNAAAALLALSALAAGREVIVSRGELVEIGGGFRVPDVLAQSGAILREVGTTNRTRASDYAAAIGDRTAVLLRVHPSNFTIAGFTERPALAELTALARRFSIPLLDDLGSGWLDLGTPPPAGLAHEPTVQASLAAGADLVCFSGDKLLGGPQAGILAGRADLIERARRHPLMRAVRAGKLTYATLDATLELWTRAPARADIPVYRMLMLGRDAIHARATALAATLQDASDIRADVIDGASAIGGGAAPGAELPTSLVAIASATRSASALAAALRVGTPPVVARIEQDRVLIDLRTVDAQDDDELAHAIRAI